MGPVRIAAMLVVLAGVLALVYGGFSYTSKDTAAKLGPLEIKVQKENRVNVPMWAGVAAIVVGGLLFVGAPRR
jgi:TRAP-type C4-dicarboxylate transport system permease small subunit